MYAYVYLMCMYTFIYIYIYIYMYRDFFFVNSSSVFASLCVYFRIRLAMNSYDMIHTYIHIHIMFPKRVMCMNAF